MDDIIARLRDAGVPQPGYEARRITAWAARRSADGRPAITVDEVVRRRVDGELLAHVLGETMFMGRSFACGPDTFPPQPASRLVVEGAIEHALTTTDPRVVDLCCGVGALGVSVCLGLGGGTLVGYDISATALEFARTNARAHGVRASFIEADIGDPGRVPRECADVVIANPPYFGVADPVDNDARRFPREAVFADDEGRWLVRLCVRVGAEALRPGGVLVVEHHERMDAVVAAVDVGDMTLVAQTRSASARFMAVSCFRR
ncbi:N5-glutamine methyltransferase family protein [Saccharothrix texasensis]|uniref:[protein release factor]-glutamine N5-methyltransferase n=1 Tax=Saccharothrix texasensis TaxID=103734 RepID=A0A3N1GXI7_9PSEU|nr:methyltransferase domain-containing protein [Saccharothrix texasensis]ROP34937.1 [protein release factor]-glutamine N5-methyltransferase [Saccharothrix texasensis]